MDHVARCVEGLGHEVIIADHNFAPMYATRTRKVKTDRRDARALAEACLLGAYRPAHRLSDPIPSATCASVTRQGPRGDPRARRAMTENHLSLKRWILPVAVLGSSGTNSIQRGYL